MGKKKKKKKEMNARCMKEILKETPTCVVAISSIPTEDM
jgi:hypothetical protein